MVVGVVRSGEITRNDELIGKLKDDDRVEVLPLVMIGAGERLSQVTLEVSAFDLAPTGETWPT